MARRKLSDEEIEEIAKKEWKKGKVFSSDENLARRAKNLTGPKTVEGKKRSLENIRPGSNKDEMTNRIKHGGYVNRILDEDEKELYHSRREDYLLDYDINSSADEITLHQVLMEEVKYYRLMTYSARHPTQDIDAAIDACTNRLNKALDNLGALRKQRLKQNDKTKLISISTISQEFYKQLTAGDIAFEIEQNTEEERKFLEEKRKRDYEGEDIEIIVEEDDLDE